MKSFPMFIRTTGRTVVIAGGGEQAAQKARLIRKTDARIVLAAPVIDPELEGLVAAGAAEHAPGPVTAGTFRGAAFAFVATGCPGADAALSALAGAAGVPVNVVDQPALCDLVTPSIVDRDPVVVAIGTEGTAPVLARSIKTDVETLLPPSLGSLAALAGTLRAAVARRVPKADRRAFWRWVFRETPAKIHARGSEREAARMIKSAVEQGRAPGIPREGRISLVGAGPGARDLLTMRAVARLQEADVIFYDRLVDPDVLELARRDAERVFVGKEVGASAWPQDRISSVIVAEARKGRQVVRLKSGDPSIFGRATEELEAARAAGIAAEIVPGITAASGAAAAMGESLTRRGETDTLVLTTGTCRPGDPAPDWVAQVRPGTAVVLYMAVRNAPAIVAELRASGLPDALPVDVCARVTQDGERLIRTDLSGLTGTLQAEGITGTALIWIRYPKAEAPDLALAGIAAE